MHIRNPNIRGPKRHVEEDIWQTIMRSLLKFSLDPKIHNKHFCKWYIIAKVTLFTRLLLCYLPFRCMVGEMVKLNPRIRFKYVRIQTLEVATDVSAEYELC